MRQLVTPQTRAVLLGEASHGTEEFYTLRAELTRACIEHSGEMPVVIGVEAPQLSVVRTEPPCSAALFCHLLVACL